MSKPDSWSDRLVSFAFSAVLAAVMLRFAWSEVQPLLPVIAGGLAVYGFFKWQQHR